MRLSLGQLRLELLQLGALLGCFELLVHLRCVGAKFAHLGVCGVNLCFELLYLLDGCFCILETLQRLSQRVGLALRLGEVVLRLLPIVAGFLDVLREVLLLRERFRQAAFVSRDLA